MNAGMTVVGVEGVKRMQ
ncbi:protein of unknown function [Candidatus Filomicrobium marinum]|uniref:Uncharacterized protein n=1 Tax=Candidatus Filomicrobium marinum TaxID=1608628 RepID=A0A0D6JIJ0_9HYPH|nr:protein of unknown function [Candidatus Filomicrobium marinum]CPR21756.1 protein of unknown function [Candidatus Filomicrobium marinum]